MNDLINRKGAINAVCTVLYPDADKMNDAKKVLKEMPPAQPEYYDYSDIEPLWKSFAEENDINLTDTAKQLKDAMWCGYRKGKADAQSEQRWIPCKERLPEEDNWLGGSGKQFSDHVLISILNSDDEDEWVNVSCTIDGEWTFELPRHCKILAWMPLPEPYREEGAE